MLPRGSPRYRGWLGTRVCPSSSRADRTAVDGDRYNAAQESREPRPRSNTALPGSTLPELHKLPHCNKGGMDVRGKGVEPFAPGRERLWIGRVTHSQEQECSSRPGCPLAPEPGISTSPTRSAIISLTSTFSPSLLGELRFGYTRIQNNSAPTSAGFDIASLDGESRTRSSRGRH